MMSRTVAGASNGNDLSVSVWCDVSFVNVTPKYGTLMSPSTFTLIVVCVYLVSMFRSELQNGTVDWVGGW